MRNLQTDQLSSSEWKGLFFTLYLEISKKEWNSAKNGGSTIDDVISRLQAMRRTISDDEFEQLVYENDPWCWE